MQPRSAVAAVGALGTLPLYDALSYAQKKLLTESYAVDLHEQETREDPYDGSYPPDDTGSDGLTAAKVCTSRGFISGYTHATNVTAMQAALQDTPVIIGINWYEGFDHPDPNTGIVYPFHQQLPRARRRTTVVLPTRPDIDVMVHELGHVLDASLCFESKVTPVTWYGKTNRYEAFAEAFAAWALPYGHGYGVAKDRLYEKDPRTVALFDRLAMKG